MIQIHYFDNTKIYKDNHVKKDNQLTWKIFSNFQSEQSNEVYLSRHGAEDTHSQLSEDGDSGRGGSVSDGHMGISQDAGT